MKIQGTMYRQSEGSILNIKNNKPKLNLIVKNDIKVDANLCGFCGNNRCNFMIKKLLLVMLNHFIFYRL